MKKTYTKVEGFYNKSERDLAEEITEFIEENDQYEIEVVSCQYQVSTYNEPGYGVTQVHFALLIYKVNI